MRSKMEELYELVEDFREAVTFDERLRIGREIRLIIDKI